MAIKKTRKAKNKKIWKPVKSAKKKLLSPRGKIHDKSKRLSAAKPRGLRGPQKGKDEQTTRDRSLTGDQSTSAEFPLYEQVNTAHNIPALALQLVSLLEKGFDTTKSDQGVSHLAGRSTTHQRSKEKIGGSKKIEPPPSSVIKTVVRMLINLLCRSCGLLIDLQPWQVQEDAISNILEEVLARIEPEREAYTLVNKNPKFKKFPMNLSFFFQSIVEACGISPVIVEFMDQFTPWVVAMSQSKSRAFRHTATLCAYAMITGLHTLVQYLRASLPITLERRQHRALKEKLSRLILELYREVFTLRIRDLSVDIRLLSVNYLQKWLTDFPTTHPKLEYVKHLGFLLHDKKAEVRCACLEALAHVYTGEKDILRSLESFTERFRSRYAEMTRDVDMACVVAALRVCTFVREQDARKNQLESEEGGYDRETLSQILNTCFDDRTSVRRAAGSFLKCVLQTHTARLPEGERLMRHTEMLLGFVAEARDLRGFSNAARYVVDALGEGERHVFRMLKPRKTGNLTSKRTLLEQLAEDLSPLVLITQNLETENRTKQTVMEVLAAMLEHFKKRSLARDAAKEGGRKKIVPLSPLISTTLTLGENLESKQKKEGEGMGGSKWSTLSEASFEVLVHSLEPLNTPISLLFPLLDTLRAMDLGVWVRQGKEGELLEMAQQYGDLFLRRQEEKLHEGIASFLYNISVSTEAFLQLKGNLLCEKIGGEIRGALHRMTPQAVLQAQRVWWSRTRAFLTHWPLIELQSEMEHWLNFYFQQCAEGRAKPTDAMHSSPDHGTEEELSRSINLSLEINTTPSSPHALLRELAEVPRIGEVEEEYIHLLTLLTTCLYRTTLWRYIQEGAHVPASSAETLEPAPEHFVCVSFLTLAYAFEENSTEMSQNLVQNLLLYVCDFALLPRVHLTEAQKDGISSIFNTLVRGYVEAMKKLKRANNKVHETGHS